MTTTTLDKPVFTLTPDQQVALDALFVFLSDPIETVFVLSGYSGCGKSTLVTTFIERLEAFYKTAKLINPSVKELEPDLTATTNKAAENLSQITGREVRTIQSFLGLRVETNFKTKTSKLIAKPQDLIEGRIIFIDEASFCDKELLGFVFSRTKNCKIIFIGDPAQLIQFKTNSAPVFEAGFSGAALTQVVRQAEGNPIVDLSTKFRHTVTSGEFFGFTPDGHHVIRCTRDEFNKAIELEFSRPGWSHSDSKILSWTNRCAVAYNGYVRNVAKGDPHFQEGDYAVCNSYLQAGKQSIKTDEMVLITDISEDLEVHGVMGNYFQMNHTITAFMPKSLAEKNARAAAARKEGTYNIVSDIEGAWVDLRGAYSSTINKAQGSTYDKVFIDLDDISGCNSGDQIARMLYVAVSRARSRVYLTGDLVA